MPAQHTVMFDGVELTRLPVGRAHGSVWLSFVGRGSALEVMTADWDGMWLLRDHVIIDRPDGTRAEIRGSGASGGDGRVFFEVEIGDVGDSRLVLTYVDDGQEIDHETVPIPS